MLFRFPFGIGLCRVDSRVVPEIAFDTGLGELFAVRVAGKVSNTTSITSMEYAVAHLGIPLLVVLAHQSCGAVTAAVCGGDNGYNLNHLLDHIRPAIHACGEGAEINDIAKKNAVLTVKDLTTKSEIISQVVQAGALEIIPAYYHLDSCKIDFF